MTSLADMPMSKARRIPASVKLYVVATPVDSTSAITDIVRAGTGTLSLMTDQITAGAVTAALSALDAFHYLHLPHPHLWAAGGIALIGVINYFGPTKAGTLALVVALVTIVFTAIIGMAYGDATMPTSTRTPLVKASNAPTAPATFPASSSSPCARIRA